MNSLVNALPDVVQSLSFVYMYAYMSAFLTTSHGFFFRIFMLKSTFVHYYSFTVDFFF